jgi:signal transduction histidine kinase
MPAPAASHPPSPRITLLLVLLLTTVLLAGSLAYEAHDAARSHRVTAERALRDYASVAARELVAEARERRERVLGDVLDVVTATIAASPYEPLAAPRILLDGAAPFLRCDAKGAPAPFLFRLDLRDGSLAIDGTTTSPAPSTLAWLRDSIPVNVRTRYRPDARVAVAVQGGAKGVGPSTIAYAVRYAQHRAPIAVYGIVSCPERAVLPMFDDVARTHPLLPAAVTGGAGNDSLFALTVFAADGMRVFHAGGADRSAFAGTVAADGLDGWTAEAALRPIAAERLLVGRPLRSRLPLLFGLLALTVVLAAVALLQLRREHELARLRADFTSSVSHELRTPLAQILLFGETLSFGRVRTDADRKLAADTIVHEARRLMHMVDNVLHFTRESASELPLGPVDVAATLDAVVTGFAPLAAMSGAEIETCFPGPIVALADEGAVRQVALNLLDNAVKYGPGPQTIRVSAVRDGDRVRIAVDDEGRGVPVEERERVWAPYVRLARDRNAARGGSGIGLAVVRELVTLMGGTTRVEDAPGGGARFVVELSAAADPTRSAALLVPSPASDASHSHH